MCEVSKFKSFPTRGGFCPIGNLNRLVSLQGMNTRGVTNRIQDWHKRATENVKRAGRVTDDYVNDNAWSTLAIAALVGCIVGYLIAQNRD